MSQYPIKSVAFGGFDKQDVVRYIEQYARDAAAQQETLQRTCETLEEELSALRAEADTLRSQVEALTAAKAQLQASLQNEQAARERLEPLQSQCQTLEQELSALRPDAEAYAQFRQRLGAIECEARKRASDLEQATADTLLAATHTFQNQYQLMMQALNSTADHVTGELRKMEVTVSQLPRAMDQTGADLTRLSTLLDKARKGENN